jgi:hypothetical protein
VQVNGGMPEPANILPQLAVGEAAEWNERSRVVELDILHSGSAAKVRRAGCPPCGRAVDVHSGVDLGESNGSGMDVEVGMGSSSRPLSLSVWAVARGRSGLTVSQGVGGVVVRCLS